MAPARPLALGLLAVLLTGGLTACGSDGTSPAPPPPQPTAKPQDFPKPAGRTLGEIQGPLPQGPNLAPSVTVLDKGANRFGFALLDPARKQINAAQVAVYTSDPSGNDVRGPYVASSESLAVKPSFTSQITKQDPDAAKSVYVVQLPFKRTGRMALTALVRLDGRLMATPAQIIQVGAAAGRRIPGPGDMAIRIDTPTVASAGGDEASIDTRVPPAPELHEVDFADVLGKKPTVLMFATPQLCQSRVCGPVVDIALQAKAAVGDSVAFVHQEIYRNNKIEDGVRPQLTAWHLQTEPWTFVIDRTGRITTRFEGAFSPGELQRAIAKAQ